ncbi:MAG TPA: HEAT repeat domain-containing protein [Planctomycetota bacterium]
MLHLSLVAILTASVFAQAKTEKANPQKPPPEDPAQAADILGFAEWLKQYRAGAHRFYKNDKLDEEAITQLDARLGKLAQWNTFAAAKALFEAASFQPEAADDRSSTDRLDYLRELQPWRVQTMACNHLRTMTGEGILPWLLQKLNSPGIRAGKQQDMAEATAVLRTLGGHKSVEAQLALLRACSAMPTDLRVHAVNAMAKDATLELVPTLVEMLRDSEPNVRIAAANAIGTALQPHVDETLGKKPAGDVLAQRDQAITKLEELLMRDQIWQVRSAAAFALAIMKCKAVVPSLIRGLDAELKRKKDPWAMDLRLHRVLEGLTGQKVLFGDITLWQTFWTREGPGFTVKPQTKAGEAEPKSDKYQKFFNLQVESDRVLFVLDFSGSMAEPIELKTGTTVAGPGTKTTKAAIIVSELKKLIMSLPDGALINLVVFSEQVKIWRPTGARPELVKLNDETRDDLIGNFLDSLRPSGPTNLYDAMNAALDFAGRGLHDKYYAAGFDTLYVISDGAPTAGPVVDKEEIRRRVREANQLRKLTIHCITFGDKNDTDFLGPMAVENGGRHIHIE